VGIIGGIVMVPVTALLTAIERKDVTTLNDFIDCDGMAEAHFTHEEAIVLWEAGWQEWLGSDKAGNAHWHAGEEWSEFHQASWEAENACWDPQLSLHTPSLWHITLGVFLHLLHARCPELPGAPAWAELWDVEEA
jgi:hypothetical protein